MPTIRYWAGARAAAGVPQEAYDAATLAELVAAAGAAHGERLRTVLGVCAFLVDEQPVGNRPHADVMLGAASVVEALPPFAGG